MPTNEERVHLNDIGTVFRVTLMEDDVAVNLAGYTSVDFRFRKPDGTYLLVAGTVEDQDDGIISYTTVDGDLDTTGRWWLEILVDIPGWTGTTSKKSFFVYENL